MIGLITMPGWLAFIFYILWMILSSAFQLGGGKGKDDEYTILDFLMYTLVFIVMGSMWECMGFLESKGLLDP